MAVLVFPAAGSLLTSCQQKTMKRYSEKFLRYLEIEKNYSSLTLLNYQSDLEDFNNFLNPVRDADSHGRTKVSNGVNADYPD